MASSLGCIQRLPFRRRQYRLGRESLFLVLGFILCLLSRSNRLSLFFQENGCHSGYDKERGGSDSNTCARSHTQTACRAVAYILANVGGETNKHENRKHAENKVPLDDDNQGKTRKSHAAENGTKNEVDETKAASEKAHGLAKLPDSIEKGIIRFRLPLLASVVRLQ